MTGLGNRPDPRAAPGRRDRAPRDSAGRGRGERARRPGSAPDEREPDDRAGDSLRLFVAVPLDEYVREVLAGAVEAVRTRFPQARWQASETWHLTLRFLGATAARDVPRVEVAVREVAASVAPFEVSLGRPGAFHRGRGGDVAWVGVERGATQLGSLARGLAAALAPASADDEGPFHAHLTLAREAPDGVVAALAAVVHPGSPWLADRIVLYRSELGRGGARHTPLVEAGLGG